MKNMEPQKLVVWVDVSPFGKREHFQVPLFVFGGGRIDFGARLFFRTL